MVSYKKKMNKKIKYSKNNRTQTKKEEEQLEEMEVEKKNNYLKIYHIYTDYIYTPVKICISISGIYLIWIILHYFAAHLYVKLCVPNTIVGFMVSPFLIATPYCIGLRWLITTGSNTINNMWVLLGSWICTNISIFKPIDSK